MLFIEAAEEIASGDKDSSGICDSPQNKKGENTMREYATQMEAARKGIITPELTKVAEKEHMSIEELMPLVASGKVVICATRIILPGSPGSRFYAEYKN